ncbi:MAG: MFS transporter [Sandaracinus sp.]|nr:MFS transporter [Sandaracinus sp.]
MPTTSPPSRRAALRWSVVDGALHAVMLGTSETYLGALAVELGHRDVALSLLGTVPLLVGALAQLASPHLVRAFGSEKRFVVTCVVLQALAHLGFLAIALSGSTSLPALLATKTVYWASGMIIGPAWNAWMARLVPPKLRAPYFARRNMTTHAAMLLAFFASGFVIENARSLRGNALLGFGLLYAVAMTARLGSAFALARKASFVPPGPPPPRPRLGQVIRAGRWRVALYAAAMLFGAQLAIPFFTPYMLRELGLDLTEYAMLSSCSILAKAIAFRLWKRAKLEPVAMLALSGALIALTPFVWYLTPDLRVIVLAQVVGGVAWAGYDLASLELLMGDAPAEGQVEFFAMAASLAAITQVAGALLGGWALRAGTFDYATVFLASSIGRASALLFVLPLLPVRKTMRRVRMAIRIVGVRPSTGAIATPALPEEDES